MASPQSPFDARPHGLPHRRSQRKAGPPAALEYPTRNYHHMAKVEHKRAKAEMGAMITAYKSQLMSLYDSGTISLASLVRSVEVANAIWNVVQKIPKEDWDQYSKTEKRGRK